MIIRLTLMLFTGATLCFITASILNLLLLSAVAEQSVKLGVSIWLGLLLFLSALIVLWLIKTAVVAVSQFFTARRRIERRVLFYSNQLIHAERSFHLKKKRLQYIRQLQRKQLQQKAFKN